MAGSPAGAAPPSPPPSNSGSSAPTFKSNASGPSPGREPAHVAFASQQAAVAAAPPPVRVPSDALVSVLGVVGELRARGLLAELEIPPEAELTDARASDLFDAVLAASLDVAEAWDSKAASCLTIPPTPLEGNRKVELLRLFLAVRARGGFAAVASWAAVAEAVGLDPAADMAVKLMYRKYLELLDQTFDKPIEDHKVVESCGHADQSSGATKDRFLSPTKGTKSAGSAHLKRKRDPFVGMLNWVRLVAKSPAAPGMDTDPHGHFDTAVWLRDNAYCLSGERLEGMLNWVRRVAESPAEPGVMGEDSCLHLSTAALLRNRRMLAEGPATPQSGHSNEVELESTDRLFAAPIIRPCGQADIPEWTGKPSSHSEDRREFRFLGELILLPESNEALDGGSIGKGRQDDCSCQFPGSIDCIKLHVAEKKHELKIGLGSAFCKMGLHQIGEDAALTWTKADERRFNTVIQDNLPTSKYNFWDKLRAAFRSKGSKGLVSYYHNVFQVQRRAYQNHLALDADSDDDNIEPDFLYSRQEGSLRSAAASRKRGSS